MMTVKRRHWILAPLAAALLGGCVIAPVGRGGGAVVVAPPLPVVVELGIEPFYFHGGFYYHYRDSRWSYARSRSGPWIELPRSHYPRETRWRGRDDRRDDDRDRRDRRDRDGDRDRRDRDDRGRDRDDRDDRGPDRGRDRDRDRDRDGDRGGRR